jgi:hypothetical protein
VSNDLSIGDNEAASEELVAEILSTLGAIKLTVDELATLTRDLDLPDPLGGEFGVSTATVDTEAARRSLLAKGFAELEEGSLALAPWFTLLTNAVSEPLLSVRMKRVLRDVNYEWTLFLDGRIGVQQQTGGDGVVLWAPFCAEHLVDIIFDALSVTGESPAPGADLLSFSTTMGSVNEWEEGFGERFDADTAQGRYQAGLDVADRASSMIVVADFQKEEPVVKDLAWLDLSRFGRWMISIPDGLPEATSEVTVSELDTKSLVQAVLSLLPIDAAEVMELAQMHT